MGERVTIDTPKFPERFKLFLKYINNFNPRTYKWGEISDEEVMKNEMLNPTSKKKRKHNYFKRGFFTLFFP
jgi:hypothetical protein